MYQLNEKKAYRQGFGYAYHYVYTDLKSNRGEFKYQLCGYSIAELTHWENNEIMQTPPLRISIKFPDKFNMHFVTLDSRDVKDSLSQAFIDFVQILFVKFNYLDWHLKQNCLLSQIQELENWEKNELPYPPLVKFPEASKHYQRR